MMLHFVQAIMAIVNIFKDQCSLFEFKGHGFHFGQSLLRKSMELGLTATIPVRLCFVGFYFPCKTLFEPAFFVERHTLFTHSAFFQNSILITAVTLE